MKSFWSAFPAAALCLCLSGLTPAHANKIRVVERASSNAVLDLGAKGDSAGDILTFANELYDVNNKIRIGSDQGWCIRIVPGKSWECVATAFLESGQITAQGTLIDGQDSAWAITGGTGRYTRAYGEMILHARDTKGSEYDMEFRLQ